MLAIESRTNQKLFAKCQTKFKYFFEIIIDGCILYYFFQVDYILKCRCNKKCSISQKAVAFGIQNYKSNKFSINISAMDHFSSLPLNKNSKIYIFHLPIIEFYLFIYFWNSISFVLSYITLFFALNINYYCHLKKKKKRNYKRLIYASNRISN